MPVVVELAMAMMSMMIVSTLTNLAMMMKVAVITYVPMVMMVTYVVGCSRLGAAWYLDSHQC